MRFVSSYCLTDNMVVGENLYHLGKGVLVNKGQRLTNVYIDEIKRAGYSGVYAKEPLSAIGTSKRDFKWGIVKDVQHLFKEAKNKVTLLNDTIERDREFVENLLLRIMDGTKLIVNIRDIKVYDEYTFQHSKNVGILAILLGMALNLSKDELYELGVSALLHDVGKVFIRDEIVKKPGKLTNEEFANIKEHPQKGFEYLSNHYGSIPVKSINGILEHHERCDGMGYPYGKKANDISLYGKMIAIVDVYDAMTTDRPYRKRLLPSEAKGFIMDGVGTAFDKELAETFVKKVAI